MIILTIAEMINVKLDMIFFDFGGTLDIYPGDKESVKRSCTEMTDILIKQVFQKYLITLQKSSDTKCLTV